MKILTEKEKAERYTLIEGYFTDILRKRADKLREDMVCYDGMRKPRHMDETEREEEVIDAFISQMDELGFWEFAELMAHEFCGEPVSENNQFHDHVYGD